MERLLQFFIWIPLIGFVTSLIIPRKRESIISGVAIAAVSTASFAILLFSVIWLVSGSPILTVKHFTIYAAGTIDIFVSFYFDTTTLAFSVVGSLILTSVTVFSKFYMHREEGFKRYFNMLLAFNLGYNLVIFSGNFDTLFIGWEVIGISSFLLISFYRDRYLPVKNGLKVISYFRLADICFMLAMWMSHQVWHGNITFSRMNDINLVSAHLAQNYGYAVFISLMLFFAAAIKSAQFPFSSWLPRAMEGPTTSSAIFYGSLSVHIGIFLLLRTYPYWESMLIIKIAIIVTGIFTSLVAASISKVQPTVKTQIAYSSIAQIGLIFIEVGLGLHMLALIHFAGNAFLRTYQLLVSPSVLSYKVHEMYVKLQPERKADSHSLFNRIKNSFYILALREWNLDMFFTRGLINPIKWAGKKLNFLSRKVFIAILIFLFLLGLGSYFLKESMQVSVLEYLPVIFSLGGLFMTMKAFTERGDARIAWLFAISGQLFITLSIAFLNQDYGLKPIFIFLSGSLFSVVIGYVCLKIIKEKNNDIGLDRFHGYIYEYRGIGLVFLLSCLGLIGLPISPSFIGIDLLFSHIHKNQEWIIIFTSISYFLLELTVLRIYARIFMGQNTKENHPIAYRSS